MSNTTDNDAEGEHQPPELYVKGSKLMELFGADDFHTNERENEITLVWQTKIDADEVDLEVQGT